MKNARLIQLEARMALGIQDMSPEVLSVTRLGFTPSKISETTNRQTKAKVQNQKSDRHGLKGTKPSKKRYLRDCNEKTRFKSLEHAKEAKERIRCISIMESSNGQASSYLPTRAYFCTNCAGFHLTSRADRFEVQIDLVA
jgi:hypothetical protein